MLQRVCMTTPLANQQQHVANGCLWRRYCTTHSPTFTSGCEAHQLAAIGSRIKRHTVRLRARDPVSQQYMCAVNVQLTLVLHPQ
jgi:hypothetical protein